MSDKPQTHKSIWAALVAFQRECPPIEKSSKGQIGHRSFTYAGRPETWAAIKNALTANGLCVHYRHTENNVTCFVRHESMDTAEETPVYSSHPIPTPQATGTDPFRNYMQTTGMMLEHARRQTLVDALGLVTQDHDADTPAETATAKAETAKPEPAPAKPAAAKPTIWTADELLTGIDHWTDCRASKDGKQVVLILQKNGLNATGALFPGMVRNVLSDERRAKLGPGMAEKLEATCNQIAP